MLLQTILFYWCAISMSNVPLMSTGTTLKTVYTLMRFRCRMERIGKSRYNANDLLYNEWGLASTPCVLLRTSSGRWSHFSTTRDAVPLSRKL